MCMGTPMAAPPDVQESTRPRTLADASLPQRARQTLEHLQQAISVELGRQLQVVLHETEVALTRLADQARDPHMEAIHFASLDRLQKGRAEFIPRYMALLESSLASLHGPRRDRRLEELHAPAQGLSLVDEEEMTDEAVLGSIASRSDSRNSLALQLMGHRFGVLAGAPAFDAEHLPLGPHALTQALRKSSDHFQFPPDARLLFYRQFEKVVMAHYPALLDALNAHLAEDGILPHLSFVPVRMRPATPGMPPPGASMPGPGDSSTGYPASPSAHPASSATQHVPHPHTAPPGTAHAHPGTPQISAAPAGIASPGGGTTPHAPAQPAPATTPARGFPALQDLLHKRRVLLAKLRPGGQDERVREPLARDEVLTALQRMRNNGGKPGRIPEIRQTLLAQARQSHGHGVALSDADNDTFELLGIYFTQLQRELRTGSPGETLVERLRLPLLQLAIRDHRFFVDATHPARMLLEAVSLAGARWLAEDDVDAQSLGLLQRAVATVQQDSDGAFDVFVDANHTLQSGLHALARKVEMAERRQVEAARGREKLELARKRANDEIAHLLGGRSLPRFHAILMDQAWADVLALTYLRHGEDSDAWRETRSTTRAIIDAATDTVGEAPEPDLAARLQSALAQVGYHADDGAAIARQLANGRAEDEDLASRTELILQLRARARLGQDSAPHATSDTPIRNPAQQAACEKLRTHAKQGCWIELDDDEETPVRRRLAWVSARTPQALVLNRRGLRVAAHEDLDALARLAVAGKLRILDEDLAPAESAWEATMANLQRISGSAANDTERAHGH